MVFAALSSKMDFSENSRSYFFILDIFKNVHFQKVRSNLFWVFTICIKYSLKNMHILYFLRDKFYYLVVLVFTEVVAREVVAVEA